MGDEEWPFLDVVGIILSVIDPAKAKERADLAAYRALSLPAAVNYLNRRTADAKQDLPQD